MEIVWYKNDAFAALKKRMLLYYIKTPIIVLILSVFLFVISNSVYVTIIFLSILLPISLGWKVAGRVLFRRGIRLQCPTDVGFSKDGLYLKYSDSGERTILWNDVLHVELSEPSRITDTPFACGIIYKSGKLETNVAMFNDTARETYKRFEEYKKLPGVAEELRSVRMKVFPKILRTKIITQYIFVLIFAIVTTLFLIEYLKSTDVVILIFVAIPIPFIMWECRNIIKLKRKGRELLA